MEGKRKKRKNTKKKKKNKTGAWGQESPRKRERDHRVLVRDSLSYGINGGLMGYERMFYWKQ